MSKQVIEGKVVKKKETEFGQTLITIERIDHSVVEIQFDGYGTSNLPEYHQWISIEFDKERKKALYWSEIDELDLRTLSRHRPKMRISISRIFIMILAIAFFFFDLMLWNASSSEVGNLAIAGIVVSLALTGLILLFEFYREAK